MGAHIIDLNKIYISADEVLGIAEENGGKAARQNVNNNCELYLLFNKNWEVVYASEANGLSLLEIVINPYTGKIISSR